jgi:hypothetical protein
MSGHHGLSSAREGASIRMDTLLCYEHFVTTREPSPG